MRTVCVSQRGVEYVHATVLRGAAQLVSDAEN